MTPRPYLSFSQLTTFERSPEKYADLYLYDKKQRITRNIAKGSDLADSLKDEEASGDPLLDLVIAKMPKFDRMDLPVEDPSGVWVTYQRDNKEYRACVPVLENKGGNIPILALPDTAKSGYGAFKEYKSSVRKFTKKMVDDSSQITFYATAMWLVTGKVPEDIELVCVETEYVEHGRVEVTGNIYRYPTKRTVGDIIRMTKRIRGVWAGIQELCRKELQ